MSITKDILLEAADIVTGKREHTYGNKRKMQENVAGLWNAFLKDKLSSPLEAQDVAILMGLLKVGRMMQGGGTRDNFVDAAAYLAMAGELGLNDLDAPIPRDPSPVWACSACFNGRSPCNCAPWQKVPEVDPRKVETGCTGPSPATDLDWQSHPAYKDKGY